MNIQKITKYEEKFYKLITAITLYLFISILKKTYYGLYTIKYNNLQPNCNYSISTICNKHNNTVLYKKQRKNNRRIQKIS